MVRGSVISWCAKSQVRLLYVCLLYRGDPDFLQLCFTCLIVTAGLQCLLKSWERPQPTSLSCVDLRHELPSPSSLPKPLTYH